MNVEAKICGIGRDIVGASTSSRFTKPGTYVPGNPNRAAGPTAQQVAALQAVANLKPAQAKSFLQSSGSMSQPLTPQVTMGINPATGLPALVPATNTANPYNTPGLPGYNPALPPNTAAGATPYNYANPYNTPGLPGYNPYQPTNPLSGYNAANPYNMPGLPGYNAYAPSTQQPYTAPSYYGDYNAPTAADFGLPSYYDPTGGSGLSPDLSYAFSDPTDMNAMASYYDPMSQIGPWSGY